jgi:hypothetical protein
MLQDEVLLVVLERVLCVPHLLNARVAGGVAEECATNSAQTACRRMAGVRTALISNR